MARYDKFAANFTTIHVSYVRMATLPVEDIQYSEEIEGLVYKKLDGGYRGWRVELLVEQITSKLEEKFLLCSYCSALMRDACLQEKEGKQELRCLVCIPEDIPWQPVNDRKTINEKPVSKIPYFLKYSRGDFKFQANFWCNYSKGVV